MVTYAISGGDAERHRQHIQKAMGEAAKWTKLKITEIASQSDEKSAAFLQFEVVKNDELPDTMSCVSPPRWVNWMLTKVVVKVQSKNAW